MKFYTINGGSKYSLITKRSFITGENVQALGMYEDIMKKYDIDSLDELETLIIAGKKNKKDPDTIDKAKMPRRKKEPELEPIASEAAVDEAPEATDTVSE